MSDWVILNTYKKEWGGSRRTIALVRCKCGKEEERRLDHVEKGRTKMCKSCSSKETLKNHPDHGWISHKGKGGISKTHFSHIKHTAERRGIAFNLSIDFLWELFNLQEGKCALTGRNIELSPCLHNNNVDWENITASLDRIDSSRGYTVDNVQWVHKEINRVKNDYPQDIFISICREVADHSRGGQPVDSSTTPVPYEEALKHQNIVYEEEDVCKGGVCGV